MTGKLHTKHVSADGKLILLVEIDEQEDFTVGFKGFPWHTHGDILASEYSLPENEAVVHFVETVLTNKAVIAIAKIGSIISDIWVISDASLKRDLQQYLRYQVEDEDISFRFWNGEPFTPENLTSYHPGKNHKSPAPSPR